MCARFFHFNNNTVPCMRAHAPPQSGICRSLLTFCFFPCALLSHHVRQTDITTARRRHQAHHHGTRHGCFQPRHRPGCLPPLPINALLRADLKKARAELRSSKQKPAVMEDALHEMRIELPPTQDLLDRVWKVVPKKKLKLDMKKQYNALRDGDWFDVQPEYKLPRRRPMQDGLRSSREQ